MDAAAGTVGGKVQIHPAKAQAVVQSNDHISIAIVDFHERLGIERGARTTNALRKTEQVRAFGRAHPAAQTAVHALLAQGPCHQADRR
ncbi:hypothetical protein ACIBI3_04870 [Actinomadura luteofluorescens]|uniref:hypothetical protein n=1 Tax=Actinomadura luteofluorescens TaxID=46163 RepID=UPI0034851352